MKQTAHIAIDLGAESGRLVLGIVSDDQLESHEVHRFAHRPVDTPTGLCWDLTGIWNQITTGLKKAASVSGDYQANVQNIGVDTWGVDGALLSKDGTLLGLPYCYREPSFEDAAARVHQRVSSEDVFCQTGVMTMSINTLYQIEHRRSMSPTVLDAADQFLFMPDLFNWLLSGRMAIEQTIASTSQMLDARTGDWNLDLLQSVGLPTRFLSSPVAPGTKLGKLRASLAQSCCLPGDTQVIAVPGHDTACAVAAIPADRSTNWSYISSGTWSLLGSEIDKPVINDSAREQGFTNELGFNDTVRFQRNIVGLWVLQQIREEFRGNAVSLTYPEMVELAQRCEPMRSLIPMNVPELHYRGGMIDRINAMLSSTGQPTALSPGELTRCCIDSLALEYNRAIQQLDALLDRSTDVIHIVGGGGKNELLNQVAADVTNRRVVVGPYEASSAGNLLVQAAATGNHAIGPSSLSQDSSGVMTYSPKAEFDLRRIRVKYAAMCKKHEE